MERNELLRESIEMMGITQATAATIAEKKLRTVQKYLSGELPVPDEVFTALLAHMVKIFQRKKDLSERAICLAGTEPGKRAKLRKE